MAKHSIFREFIVELRKDWKTTFPTVRPLDRTFDAMLPKASTFAAGVTPRTGVHAFLHFQHSDKSWRVGSFTINVTLLRQFEPLKCSLVGSALNADNPEEGGYRIGLFCGRRDKWWHLKVIDKSPVFGVIAWKPMGDIWEATAYDDEIQVIHEAIADVNRDVGSVLVKLGLFPDPSSQSPG